MLGMSLSFSLTSIRNMSDWMLLSFMLAMGHGGFPVLHQVLSHFSHFDSLSLVGNLSSAEQNERQLDF